MVQQWPNIAARKEALPEADEFKGVENKRQLFSEAPFKG
jgi:hypothetical protein